MYPHAPRTRRDAVLDCIAVALAFIASVALLLAAALVPAPTPILAVVVIIGVLVPAIGAYGLSHSVHALRGARELKRLRRHLDRLPETRHPLGI
jgi:hypothetical protein